MRASPDIADVPFPPRRRRKYRVPIAAGCLLFVGLMVASTSEPIFWVLAGILVLGIFTAYWYAISWPAVAAVVCAVGIAFFLPATHVNPDPHGRVGDCRNNLRQITLAIASYHSAHGQHPPPYTTDAEGQPLLSWRVLILPYLERRDLYEQFHLDEPWDSEHNLPLSRQMPAVFRCPSVVSNEATPYLAVVGDQTVWRSGGGITHDDMTKERLATAMLVEDPYSAVVWTEPTDFWGGITDCRFARLLRMRNETGHHRGLHVALPTGEILFIPDRQLSKEKILSLFGLPEVGRPL